MFDYPNINYMIMFDYSNNNMDVRKIEQDGR